MSLSCGTSLFGLGTSKRGGTGDDLEATNGSSSSARESFAVSTGVSAKDSPVENKQKR